MTAKKRNKSAKPALKTKPGRLKIACDVRDTLPLGELTTLQDELKELDEKDHADLRNQILSTGFAFPIYVWRDESDKKTYIVGGHQRVKVLIRLQEEGYEIPPVPIVTIHAKNIQEAKVRVLQDVSQYGRVGAPQLFDFATKAKLDLSRILQFKIPEIDRTAFIKTFFPNQKHVEFDAKEEWDGMPEFDQEDKTGVRQLIVHFKTHEDVKKFAKLIGQNLTEKTRSIWYPKSEIETLMDKRYESES